MLLNEVLKISSEKWNEHFKESFPEVKCIKDCIECKAIYLMNEILNVEIYLQLKFPELFFLK